MDNGQLILVKDQKVKLKLIQPHIKCSGRGDVTCHYKGTVVTVNEHNIAAIRFKYKGEFIITPFDLNREEFVFEEYKDIKLV